MTSTDREITLRFMAAPTDVATLGGRRPRRADSGMGRQGRLRLRCDVVALAPEADTRFLAAPTDVNWGGNTHGGRVMGWIDDAAYLCGTRW